MKKNEIEYLVLKYRFDSGTGCIEHSRFINEYEIDIWGHGENEDGIEKSQLIGKGKIALFLVGLAQDEDFSMLQLFDSTQSGSDLGNFIIDWGKEDINEDFEDILLEAGNYNILYIDRIELLPQFRGIGLGKKIMKDIILRFDNSCGLIALKAFPLQLEYSSVSGKGDVWNKQMKYKYLVQDETTARKQLYKFYKSLGFRQYSKTDYFYINPAFVNKKLDKVDIDEYMRNDFLP